MKYTKAILERVVSKSYSYAQVLKQLGLSIGGGTQSHIKSLVEKWNIDVSHFKGQAWNKGNRSPNRCSTADFFTIKNYKLDGKLTRKRLVEDVGREYRCEVVGCGIDGMWLEKEIILHIDHMNGNKYDHRLENLRFLCPNCHSQTPTWGFKRKKY